MKDYYWIMPRNAKDCNGISLDNCYCVLKAKSLGHARKLAEKERKDDRYDIYCASDKVDFAMFAFRPKLECVSNHTVNNTDRGYPYEMINLVTKETTGGTIVCHPDDLIKRAQRKVKTNSKPIQRIKYAGNLFTAQPNCYLIVNREEGIAISIRNKSEPCKVAIAE